MSLLQQRIVELLEINAKVSAESMVNYEFTCHTEDNMLILIILIN